MDSKGMLMARVWGLFQYSLTIHYPDVHKWFLSCLPCLLAFGSLPSNL